MNGRRGRSSPRPGGPSTPRRSAISQARRGRSTSRGGSERAPSTGCGASTSGWRDRSTPTGEPARPSSLDLAGPVLEVGPEPDETAYLRSILFFGAFSEAELAELFGDLRRLEAPRGAALVAQGERPGALLAVLRGAVETTIRHGGAAARARLSGPGRFAGHLGVLDEGASPVTCRARERTILLEIPHERARELLADPSRAARHFTRGLYADVVEALFQAQRPFARMAAIGG